MKPRMLCWDCGITAFADTWLAGADWLEGLGWLAGGAPGWLYCAWRHALRAKRCAHCGSAGLVRETRAAAARDPAAPPSRGVRVAARPGPLRWPAPWRDPRQRLRRGTPWIAAWALGAAGHPLEGALLAAAWLAAETARCAAPDAGAAPCRAWDASGRALRVEVV